MGEYKEKCLIQGAVAICNPFDLCVLERHLTTYMFGVYGRILTNHLLALLREHLEQVRPMEKKMGCTLEAFTKSCQTVLEFDSRFTSKMMGFGTAYNYYRRWSSALRVDDVRTPTLFLSALDDPVAWYYTIDMTRGSKSAVPFMECVENDRVILATHPCAGHLGFYGGLVPRQVLRVR